MKQLVEFDLENDKGTVLVEVNEPESAGGAARVGRVEDTVNKAPEPLEKSLSRIKPVARFESETRYHDSGVWG